MGLKPIQTQTMPPLKTGDKYLTTSEAAHWLGMSIDYLRFLIAKEKVPSTVRWNRRLLLLSDLLELKKTYKPRTKRTYNS